ncbi:hypothetical protein OKW21_004382 [Catalinimonas alkaloidigena]|uniref:hypothetical protein n=1 Tax=Catalinimonas alkaloidigena TaxID=1075417 RepID=UPI0024059A67|nr:hypothetical protein [Catalinimonas alkaloidigena]MDF9799119.1 hypothetical protein [Catalinimonas alkaloidigena]
MILSVLMHLFVMRRVGYTELFLLMIFMIGMGRTIFVSMGAFIMAMSMIIK